jgi:polyisoprenoid-binding protein YceI
VNGKDKVAFASGTTIQLVETGANTGIFRGEFSVDKITDKDTTESGTQALVDGDKITFEYKDLTESPELTRSVDVKIGKPSGTVELDRSSYPPSGVRLVNPTTAEAIPTILHITITDPARNTRSTSTDSLDLTGTLEIKLKKGNEELKFKPNSGLGFPTSANETGVNTGVFTVDVKLPRNVIVDSSNNVTNVNQFTVTTTGTIQDASGSKRIDNNWQIIVIYKDSNGDEQKATATVTTNTAQITTDKPTYDLGQTIILRVIEPDWNFDSDKVDEIL